MRQLLIVIFGSICAILVLVVLIESPRRIRQLEAQLSECRLAHPSCKQALP